jgi:hypothetical protein
MPEIQRQVAAAAERADRCGERGPQGAQGVAERYRTFEEGVRAGGRQSIASLPPRSGGEGRGEHR